MKPRKNMGFFCWDKPSTGAGFRNHQKDVRHLSILPQFLRPRLVACSALVAATPAAALAARAVAVAAA